VPQARTRVEHCDCDRDQRERREQQRGLGAGGQTPGAFGQAEDAVEAGLWDQAGEGAAGGGHRADGDSVDATPCIGWGMLQPVWVGMGGMISRSGTDPAEEGVTIL